MSSSVVVTGSVSTDATVKLKSSPSGGNSGQSAIFGPKARGAPLSGLPV